MLIAGVDEVGRGPLAGPVVAAAVVFKDGYQNEKIKDSKKLSAQIREHLVDIIKRDCVQWAIVAVGHKRIEEMNIRNASLLAMALCVRRVRADLVLVDGDTEIETPLKQRAIIGGDASHVQISAASIIAKVWRDKLMRVIDEKYPGYEFGRHAGYPTKLHRSAIATHGPCRIHRATFSGVREHLGKGSSFSIVGNA